MLTPTGALSVGIISGTLEMQRLSVGKLDILQKVSLLFMHTNFYVVGTKNLTVTHINNMIDYRCPCFIW